MHYRELNVEIQRRRKVERHAAIDRLKSVPCADCGKRYDPYVMDFDHRDPSEKKREISHLLNKTSSPWPRIVEEISKCDVVCVNCHRLRTWHPPRRLDKRRLLIISLKNRPCTDCGGTFHYCQMDFDHVRGSKVKEVSLLKSQRKIQDEAEKCDVVCANCHRKRSYLKQKVCRTDSTTVDMVWKVSRSGSLQTEIQTNRRRLDKPSYRSWHDLVGSMTDKEVSEKSGISRASVCLYRKKTDIPRFRKAYKK
jgi:hypothetical protein